MEKSIDILLSRDEWRAGECLRMSVKKKNERKGRKQEVSWRETRVRKSEEGGGMGR